MDGFLQRLNGPALAQISQGLLSGKTGPEQFGNAVGNFGTFQQQQQQKTLDQQKVNKTFQMLEAEAPELAQAVQSGIMSPDDAFSTWYKQKIEAEKPKKPNFLSVGGSLYNPDSGEWVSPPAGAGQTEYGLTPVYGTDPATGKTVIGQISKTGTFKPLDMPENFVPSTGTGTVDLGTEIGTIDRRTGQIVSRTPKNLIGAESDKAQGKTQGEARGALPQARGMVQEISRQINDLKADTYLNNMLGAVDSRLPNVSSDAARVQSKMNQLGGGAFLQARQMLKGGGAITDFESKRAEQAYARLDAAQTPEDYKTALDDFEYFVKVGLQKLEQTANVQPTQGNRTTGGVSWSREN